MKRILWILLALIVAMSLTVIIGCSDDDDDITDSVTGDLNDPDFLMFMDEFSGMDETTGEMFAFTLIVCVDTIFKMAENPEPPKAKVVEEPVYITYNPTSQFWHCTTVVTNEDSLELTVSDSLKFMHGAVAVQWPDPDSVTTIHSYATVVASGPGVTSGVVHQNLTIEPLNMGSDTIIVNGTGDAFAETGYTDVYMGDTTVCTTVLDYDVVANSLYIDMGSETDDGPYSGTISYTGTMDKTCTGAGAGSISGQWNAACNFTDGNIVNLAVSHNGIVWVVFDW